MRRVLQAWHERSTATLTQRLLKTGVDPQAQLSDVISQPFRGRAAVRAARVELAIRAWARRDEMARKAVDDADASRLAYHGQIFEALGFDAEEAQQRAFVLHSYEVAESLPSRQGTAAQKHARSAFVACLIRQSLDPEAGP